MVIHVQPDKKNLSAISINEGGKKNNKKLKKNTIACINHLRILQQMVLKQIRRRFNLFFGQYKKDSRRSGNFPNGKTHRFPCERRV
jgi:hypothetical protein